MKATVYRDKTRRIARRHRATRGFAMSLSAASALFLTCLSGCLTSPSQWLHQGFKVGPEHTPPGAAANESWIDEGDAPEAIDTNSPDGPWWTLFNDPILDELIAIASEQNLGLREAGERILEARERLAIARGNLLPQRQEAFGSFSRTQMSRTTPRPIRVPDFDNWITNFNASWELDLWGRFRRAVEASEADLAATMEDCRDTLVVLQAEVAMAYIQTRMFQQRIVLAQRNVELQTKTLELADLRFREGKTTKLDLTQAQVNLATTQALLPELEMALRESQNALCVLLSVPPYDLLPELGSASIPEPPLYVVVGIPAQLLARRPDVRRVERLVAAQSARIGVAQSELYPHIAITGTLGYESESLSNLFQSKSFTGSVGPGFRWNILNYGRILSNVLAEESRLRQLVLHYQDLVIQAQQEVENGIYRFMREQESIEFLQQAVAAAEESVHLAQEQYGEGKVDFQRLVASERSLLLLQDQLTASRGQLAIHLVAVYKALGGGWQADSVMGDAAITP